MKPEYQLGDILIKRVRNGWLVVIGSEVDETKTEVFVYEDTHEGGVRESLYHLLTDQFGDYCQSKRQSGIKMSYSNLSKEEEEECMNSD